MENLGTVNQILVIDRGHSSTLLYKLSIDKMMRSQCKNDSSICTAFASIVELDKVFVPSGLYTYILSPFSLKSACFVLMNGCRKDHVCKKQEHALHCVVASFLGKVSDAFLSIHLGMT